MFGVGWVSGGGAGVVLRGRSSLGNSVGGIGGGVEPGANGSVGHGNGDSVRVLVVPVDGAVGGNSVVAQPGCSFHAGGSSGCSGGAGCS